MGKTKGPRERLPGLFLFCGSTTGASAATGSRAAGVALAAGAAAHQRELAALGARVAFVALEAGQPDLVDGGGTCAVGLAVAVAIGLAVPVAVLHRVEMAGPRRGERLGQRLRLVDNVPGDGFLAEFGVLVVVAVVVDGVAAQVVG